MSAYTVYNVRFTSTFYHNFFPSSGAWVPPYEKTQPKSWVKTDGNGVLFILENYVWNDKDAKRYVRFDEVGFPDDQRIRSPKNSQGQPIRFLQELMATNWSFPMPVRSLNIPPFLFASPKISGEYTRIATESQIKSTPGMLTHESQNNGCIYLSDDMTEMRLGKLDRNGRLIPVVIREERTDRLPDCVFVYTQVANPNVLDIKPTNANSSLSGPYIDSLAGIPIGEKNPEDAGNSARYWMFRIPLLFRYAFIYNFPLLGPLLTKNFSKYLLSGWKVVDMNEYNSIVTENSLLNEIPTIPYYFTIDNGGWLQTISRKKVNGVVTTDKTDDRINGYLYFLLKSDTPLLRPSPLSVLDLGQTTEKFGDIRPSELDSRKYLYIVAGLIILGVVVYFMLVR